MEMGYIAHNAIICTAWDEKRLKVARDQAVSIFGGTVSEIVSSPINGYKSFFVAPDGSKEGWYDSDKGDEKREEFCRWLDNEWSNSDLWIDYVGVRYGGDEPEHACIEKNMDHAEEA
jgi:hypothetical protein